jgi:serine protease Do
VRDSSPAGRHEVLTWPLWVYVALWFALSVLTSPVGTLAQPGRASPAGAAPDLAAMERAFQEVVERVSPSVVGIRARRHYWAPAPSAPDAAGARTIEQFVVIHGSGTVLRPDGAILTNEHVVQSARNIEVVLHDGRTLPASVTAADPRSDLAILRVDVAGLIPAQLCRWDDVARGQWSVVVGNPYGLGNDGKLSVSVGVISNLDRHLPGLGEVDDRLYADMIQTTAPIHPGNSGGPLFNLRGELIGVVTAVHARSIDDEGIGFAIPMNPAKRRVLERLLAGQPVLYGYLGVTVRTLEPAERAAAGLDADAGVQVAEVDADGPAGRAGVLVGDIVTRFQQRPVTAPLQLADLVGQTAAGQDVELKLRREQTELAVRVTLDTRQLSRVSWLRSGAVVWRGMRLADLTAESRQYVKADSNAVGVVVLDVQPGSPADQARVRIGDVVEQVEDVAVGQVMSFLQAIRSREGTVRLRLRERGSVSVSP